MTQPPPSERTLILVIDDNPRNIAVVVDCLRAQGFEIITARNGTTGIERAIFSQPDLILLDVMMPGIDGFETCRQLKGNPATRAIPVLFMTVADDLDNKVRGFRAGGVDYISKPVQVEELVARVTTHLTIRHTQEFLRHSEARYRALVDHSLQGVLVFQHERIIFANPAASDITGYTTEELLTMSPEAIDTMVYPDDLPLLQRYRRMRLAGEPAPNRYEFRAVRKDGAVRWVESFNVLIEYQGHAAVQMTYIDITERKQTDERIKQMNAHLARSAADMERLTRMSSMLQRASSRQAVIETSLQFLGELFPEQRGALYLMQEDAIRLEQVATWGPSPDMLSGFHLDDCRALLQQPGHRHAHLIEEAGLASCPLAVQTDHVPCCCVPLIADDKTLGVLHMSPMVNCPAPMHEQQIALVTMAADLIGLALSSIQLREHLRDQSIRDALTGLYNRRYLDETLPRELQRAERRRQSVGIIMLDIDHFKRFNDTYGHDAGDTLLRMVGSFLQRCTRGEDIACRYGGEEFTLVLPGASLEHTRQRAEEIRAGIQTLVVQHSEHPLEQITISLGIATFPDHNGTADGVIKAADRALYRAKAVGRNQVCVAEGELV